VCVCNIDRRALQRRNPLTVEIETTGGGGGSLQNTPYVCRRRRRDVTRGCRERERE